MKSNIYSFGIFSLSRVTLNVCTVTIYVFANIYVCSLSLAVWRAPTSSLLSLPSLLSSSSSFEVASKNYSREDENYGKTWMYIPDGEGKPQIAYLTEEAGGRGRTRDSDVRDHVRFELYTK